VDREGRRKVAAFHHTRLPPPVVYSSPAARRYFCGHGINGHRQSSCFLRAFHGAGISSNIAAGFTRGWGSIRMNALTIADVWRPHLEAFKPSFADATSWLSRLVAGWRPWSIVDVNGTALPTRGNASAITLQAQQHSATVRGAAATSTPTSARFERDIVSQLDAAYNFARFLSRDADAAHDIVQEAFLRAYRGFDGYKGGHARAWVFAIVRNCYHDWLIERRRKARIEIDTHARDGTSAQDPDEVAAEDDDPETALLRQSNAGMVRLVLSGLPRQLREILVLREIEGLSYKQIAEIAAVPIGTVMSRLARARAQFQVAWQQATELQESRA
jgi:RNA polymerase sigma factor (sigma-70 family)